jgi:hypothetical protein
MFLSVSTVVDSRDPVRQVGLPAALLPASTVFPHYVQFPFPLPILASW